MRNIYLIIFFLAAISTPSFAQVMTQEEISAYRAQADAGYAEEDAYEALDRQATTEYKLRQQAEQIKELRERLDNPDTLPTYRHYDIITPY